jgi:glycosyltransferase involved in cell wall biosynthesis
MKIGVGAQLLSYPRAASGGLGTYLRGLLPALPAATRAGGHELHIFWGAEGHSLVHNLGLDDPTIHHHFSRFSLRRPQLRLPWEQTLLPAAARTASVDVFHFLDHVASLAPPAPRVVVTIHDAIPLRMPETYGVLRGHYKGLMTRVAARLATRVIAVSHATRGDLVQLTGAPGRKIRVVHNGLGHGWSSVSDPSTREALRQRYRLPARFLLYVGRLEPRKNLDRLIRAYAIARERFGVTTPLVLAGKPSWLYMATLDLPRQLGITEHVRFLTEFIPDPDLPTLYSLSDALVFPSLYEGFGLPVLEAMACGVPVLTGNVSSMPELTGDNAVLVDPYNIHEMAHGLRRILDDELLRARLAAGGPKRASSFSWERAARETVAVYEEAVGC